MHVHLAQKFIWKLQLIGRHTLTFLSRLLSNIWPQNLIFLRVSLRSPTSYLVQQSHKEITNDPFVTFKSDSVWWIATTNGGLWGSLVIMEPFFCAVASSGCQKISPITDLLCISLLFSTFRLSLHCRVFAPDLFCVRRQTNGLQWVGDRAIKEFQKQFLLSFRAAKVTIDCGILCIQSTRGQKRAGPANAKKRVGALLFLEQQMLLNLSFLFPEQLQTNGSRAIKRWLRN